MSERNEWERDLVVWLAGRRMQGQATGRPGHPGFEAWRAAGELEGGAARFAERVRARVASAGLGVELVDHLPEPAHADVPGTAALIELGRREPHLAGTSRCAWWATACGPCSIPGMWSWCRSTSVRSSAPWWWHGIPSTGMWSSGWDVPALGARRSGPSTRPTPRCCWRRARGP
jgi:hypothetical protein